VLIDCEKEGGGKEVPTLQNKGNVKAALLEAIDLPSPWNVPTKFPPSPARGANSDRGRRYEKRMAAHFTESAWNVDAQKGVAEGGYKQKKSEISPPDSPRKISGLV